MYRLATSLLANLLASLLFKYTQYGVTLSISGFDTSAYVIPSFSNCWRLMFFPFWLVGAEAPCLLLTVLDHRI